MRIRRKKWRISLNHHAVGWCKSRGGANGIRVLIGDDSGERHIRAEIKQCPHVALIAGEAMKDHSIRRQAAGGEYRNQFGKRLTTMKNDRFLYSSLTFGPDERKLLFENTFLEIKIGFAVMAIQTKFTPRDAFGILPHFARDGPVMRTLIRIQRMNAGAAPDAFMLASDIERTTSIRQGRRNRDTTRDSMRSRKTERRFDTPGYTSIGIAKLRECEMAVGIDHACTG